MPRALIFGHSVIKRLDTHLSQPDCDPRLTRGFQLNGIFEHVDFFGVSGLTVSALLDGPGNNKLQTLLSTAVARPDSILLQLGGERLEPWHPSEGTCSQTHCQRILILGCRGKRSVDLAR